jgi:hypothetical protein
MIFTHYVLTRFNTLQDEQGLKLYDKPGAEEWMQKRMVFFEKTKESVLSQSAAFQWVISIDERTPQKYIDAIFTDDRMIMVNCDIRDVFKADIIDGDGPFYEIRRPTTPWVITSRIDCDDYYNKDAIYTIQLKFEPKIKVIDLYYEQIVHSTGERFTNGNAMRGERYRMSNNGPFLSLIEPSERVMTCFCRPHSVLGLGYPFPDGNKEIPTCKIMDFFNGVPYPWAYMVIHDHNVANKITGYKI